MLSIVWDTEALGWRELSLLETPYRVAEASAGGMASSADGSASSDGGSALADGDQSLADVAGSEAHVHLLAQWTRTPK